MEAKGERFFFSPQVKGEASFVCECRKVFRNLPGSSDLFSVSKELYQELVVGFATDPLVDRFGCSVKDVRLHWNRALGSGFLNNSEFSLTWWLARNVLPLLRFN